MIVNMDHTQEAAAALLSSKCAQLRELFDECIKLSNEFNIVFELPWGGEGNSYEEGYSVGGFYCPTDDSPWGDKGWHPSNQSC